MQQEDSFLKGRGAQINTHNRYLTNQRVAEHFEGIDEEEITNGSTEYIQEFPKKIVNQVDSPDLGMVLSMNPYQGCEHGCIYCYARNTHQYWGYSSGLDFERKIIIKENAPQLLEQQINKKGWEPRPIMLSGNTDCYQPIEKKKKITRSMLEVLLRYKHPVGIITKNSLVLRDLDLLKELNELDLVHVSISITTLDESLRRLLEPRTAAAHKRLKVVETLAKEDIPVNVMMAPIIPGLNSHEIPSLVKTVADHGASSAAYTMVRLNGPIGEIFTDWVRKTFPDRADKILNKVAAAHGGKLGDSRFGVRMSGEGNEAESIRNLFKLARVKYLKNRSLKPYNLNHFIPKNGRQLDLF